MADRMGFRFLLHVEFLVGKNLYFFPRVCEFTGLASLFKYFWIRGHS